MERSVDGMKLHTEKYSEDFIPDYFLPEGYEKPEKLAWRELASAFTQTVYANHYTTLRRHLFN
jgi:hypothetical protein